MSQIFIGYDRDDLARIESLERALQARGWSTWRDESIRGGEPFDEEIERKLGEVACVVVAWSKHSVKSLWVRWEAGKALELSKLVPVTIDGTIGPQVFAQLQTIDLSRWKGDPDSPALEGLIDAVAPYMGDKPIPLAPAPRTTHRRSLAIGSLALLVLVALFTWWLSKDTIQKPDPARDALNRAVAFYSGTGGRVDWEQARPLFVEASESGDPLARMWVARNQIFGEGGFETNEKAGRELAAQVIDQVEQLAQDGESEAQYLYGSALVHGLARETQPERAAFWFRSAADAGNVVAMRALAIMFYKGEGVPHDVEQSFIWHERAATGGNVDSMVNLGYMLLHGEGAPRDVAAAFDWSLKAAEMGHPIGMLNVGGQYWRGMGVEQDREKAFDWWRQAARLGNTDAQTNLDNHYRNWDDPGCVIARPSSELRVAGVRPNMGFPLKALEFSRNGTVLAAQFVHDFIQVWALDTGAELVAFGSEPGTMGFVGALDLSPDGRTLAYATDSVIRIRDVDSLLASEGPTCDGRRIKGDSVSVCYGGDRTVIRKHAAGVDDLEFSADGMLLVSASDDGTAKIWDVETGSLIRSLEHGRKDYSRATFCKGGSVVATTGVHVVQLWDASSGELLAADLSGRGGLVWDLECAPDGTTLAAGEGTGEVYLWNIDDRRMIGGLTGHGPIVNHLEFSPTQPILASVGYDRKIRFWDYKVPKLLGVFPAKIQQGTAVGFGPDGKTLAWTSLGGAEIWSLEADCGW